MIVDEAKYQCQNRSMWKEVIYTKIKEVSVRVLPDPKKQYGPLFASYINESIGSAKN